MPELAPSVASAPVKVVPPWKVAEVAEAGGTPTVMSPVKVWLV